MIADKYSTFIFDCEGTLWNVDSTIEGAPQTIEYLKSKSKSVYLLSNLSFHTQEQISHKASKHGIHVDPLHCISAASLTCEYIKAKLIHTAYIIGMPGLVSMISGIGVKCYGGDKDNNMVASRALAIDPATVDAVIVGNDLDFNTCKLMRAINYIKNGSQFICTCNDKVFKSRDFMCPNVGFFISCIKACVNVEPVVIGKPEKYGIEYVKSKEPDEKGRLLMVGDSVECDVQLGINTGIDTALVLTGVSSKPSGKETYCINSIKHLI